MLAEKRGQRRNSFTSIVVTEVANHRHSQQHRSGRGSASFGKQIPSKKRQVVWKVLICLLNVCLFVAAVLMIFFSQQSRQLVLDFENATNTTALNLVYQNITDSWKDLTTDVAATTLVGGMYTMTLAIVGVCAVATGRNNMIICYLCYLIISEVLLIYSTSYAFLFRETFSETVEIYASAVYSLSLEIAKDAKVATIATNVTTSNEEAFIIVSNCGLTAICVVLVEIFMTVALLGCTSAIASLMMIFNIVTGVTGLIFVLLSIFIFSWSIGNEWAAAILCAAGAICAALALFGFKVAELVLNFVRETNTQMKAQDKTSSRHDAGSRRSRIKSLQETKSVCQAYAHVHVCVCNACLFIQ